jgi:hypothetical protein
MEGYYLTQRKKILIACSIVLIALVVLSGLFINNKYFFNPILYKKDNITYLNWTWYTNPLSIEYDSLKIGSSQGWKTIKIKDKQEIKIVFEELKKSEQIPEYKNIDLKLLHEVIIRPSNGSVVLDVFIDGGGKFAKLNSSNTFLKLTDKLTKLVNKRMKETK